MWDFSILLSIRLILRTIPFLVLRLTVAAVWGGILVAASFAGIIVLLAVMQAPAGSKGTFQPQAWIVLVICTLTALGLVFLLLRWLRKWALYRVKAAHVAVLVEYVQGRALPKGMGQLRYGQMVVRERLGEAAAFFALDEMIRAALRGIDRLTNHLTEALPRKVAAMIVVPIHVVLHFAASFADEIMLAHAIDARSQDATASVQRALSVYGASQPVILKNAFWLSLLAAGLGGLVYFGVLEPAWAEYQAAKTPETLRTLLVTAVASLALSAAFFGPFALICMLQVWFRGVPGEGRSVIRPKRDEPVTQQYGRYLEGATARAAAGGGPRNGDLV